VVLVYAVFAALWIMLSDKAVALLFHDPTMITRASTIKGWLFVAVTSVLLFGLMRRLTGPSNAPGVPRGSLKPLILPAGLLIAAIAALTVGEILERFRQHRETEEARLSIIAGLKTRQIADWLRERERDARYVATSRYFADQYRRWRDDGRAAAREELVARLEELQKAEDFQGVALLDDQGRMLWNSYGGTGDPDPALRAAVRQAAAAGEVRRLGPRRDLAGRPHLDFVAPLRLAGDAAPVVVLHADPEATLFRILREWPAPSPSGEALLFRRDGDRALLLSPPRHRSDGAPRLQVPTAGGDLAAGDLAQGVAYRGVPVIGAVRAVPGTDWLLSAQVDKSELDAEAAGDALWVGLAGLLALLAAMAGAFLFVQRRQLAASLREQQAQAERLQALQLLEAVSESSGDAIFAKDLAGRYLLFNREAARIIGRRPEEVLGRDDRAIFPPEQAELLMAVGRQVIAENRTVTNEEVLNTADGTAVFLATKGPLHDAAGGVVGVFGISRDITARKRAEDELRAREERLRLALQAADQGLYDLNVQSGEAVVSPEYALMLGHDPGQFRETNAAWIERLHPDDREPVAAAYRDYVAGKLPEYRVEFRQRTKDGAWKWILSLGKIVERDPQGRPLRMLGTHTDITARKHAEEALRQNEALTRAVLDNLPIGVAVNSVDPAVPFYMNDNFPRFYRTTREQLTDPDAFWTAVYEDPAFREAIKKRVLDDCASGDPQRMHWVDVPITRAGAETTYITARNTPVPGRPLMISTVWDVTERKRAEEERARLEAQLLQAQKMESIGRLAGGVAHDFNNLLFVIMGHAAMALERVDASQPLHADLEQIRKAAQRSADLTRQLLAFARRQTVAPLVLDLNQAVSALLSMLRRLLGEDIDLVWRPADGLWLVRIDPAQVDQIMANLCVNARDAIDGVGTIVIETANASFDEAYCSEHPGCLPGEYVRLAVSDDGCGMSEEILAHAFEPFYTTKETGRGTGLGLSTVYGIVKQNEGFVNVYSEPGEGTTFKVYLRRSTAGAEAAPAEPVADMPPGRGEVVLLVEDEGAVLSLAASMLQRLGYAVLTAGTTTEAIRLAEEHAGAIGLLLTDVVMPGMNGRELAARLGPANPRMKCLFMSGYTADVIAHRGVLEKHVRFLQKPFSIQNLAHKVREALDAEGPAAGAAAGAPGLRVLYVDDEEPLLALVRRDLERRGHRVTGHTDPQAALAEFQRRPGEFDYVVTDLAMPGMTGFELVRRLLAIRAGVPVAIVTGCVTPQDAAAAQALGLRAVIQKPGTVEQLGADLDRLLRGAGPAPSGTAADRS
jgi:PAS domain S-box-containing protein